MEIWKAIKGYEGKYEVSDGGKIRGLTRKSSSGKTVQGRIIKSSVSSSGYAHVLLCKDGKRKSYSVHRLVAEAFVDNPEHKAMVVFKDGDKKNPSADNLKWQDR